MMSLPPLDNDGGQATRRLHVCMHTPPLDPLSIHNACGIAAAHIQAQLTVRNGTQHADMQPRTNANTKTKHARYNKQVKQQKEGRHFFSPARKHAAAKNDATARFPSRT